MSNKIILAVDDDEDILELVSVAVAMADYKFIGVTSGSECLEILRETNPCLIILDIEMPEMDGFQVLEKIREIFPKRLAPVAFLTSHKDFDMVERGIELGCKSFILKPINMRRLEQKIEELASGR